MKHLLFVLLLGITSLLSFSCYHARIETGLEPSAKVVERSFAAGWVYGLVPPKTVKAAEECSEGVAVVETQISFVNGLVGALTLGIYTPMNIRVTCAASSGMNSSKIPGDVALVVPAGAAQDAVVAIFSDAADKAAANGQPVLVQFQ